MATTVRTKIYTHLWYATQAEEAARFYADIFPDSRVDGVWTLPSDSPSGPAGSVKVVDFDRYGLRWQIVPARLDEMMRDGDSARAKKVTDVLLKMVKLDIAALEQAYRS